MPRPWRYRLRSVVGGVSAVALIALGAAHWSGVRAEGVGVADADRTFRVVEVGPGQYAWSLESGRPASGPGLMQRTGVQVDRADIADTTLAPSVASGAVVPEGAVLLDLGSPQSARLVAELTAQRDELVARRALLLAGGRAEVVAAARRRAEVARAQLAEDEVVLARLRAVDGSGAVTAAEVDAARTRVDTRRREVDAADADVLTAQLPPRPDEVAALDAQRVAVEARLAEATARIARQQVKAPFSGLVEVGGDAIVRVYDLDPIYVRVALPADARDDVVRGADATWTSTSLPGRSFAGQVAEVAESLTVVDAAPVFYVTVALPNPDGTVRPGMSGRLTLHGPGGAAVLAAAQDELSRLDQAAR